VTITVRLTHAGTEATRLPNPVLSGAATTGRPPERSAVDVPEDRLETIHRKAVELNDGLLVNRDPPRLNAEIALERIADRRRIPVPDAPGLGPGRYRVHLSVEAGRPAKSPDVIAPVRFLSDPVEIQVTGPTKREDAPVFYYRPAEVLRAMEAHRRRPEARAAGARGPRREGRGRGVLTGSRAARGLEPRWSAGPGSTSRSGLPDGSSPPQGERLGFGVVGHPPERGPASRDMTSSAAAIIRTARARGAGRGTAGPGGVPLGLYRDRSRDGQDVPLPRPRSPRSPRAARPSSSAVPIRRPS